jgi:hypothetical protein
MNIKRAFLTAVSLLMLPGFALAQTTVRFDTSLVLVPEGPYTQSVTAELTCNTGNPLVQDFEIGPTTEDKVVFVVDNFDLEEFISCEITASGINGFFVAGIETNGIATEDDTCLWTAEDDNLSLEEDNYCVFTMAPETFTYEIEKVWEFADDVDVSQAFGINWTCYNAITGADDSTPGTVYGNFSDYGDSTFAVTSLHPNPWAGVIGGVTSCVASEYAYDSAVESDYGCETAVNFTVEDNVGGCTVTNSVFFEGIPTLSQYGLAVMALLMLGVGFVGFRRFV